MTRLMSTSNTVVTCAEVRRLITMCSAIFLRIALMGTTVTRSPGANTGAAARDTPAAAAVAPAPGPPPSIAFRMSFFVTRPLAPVPAIREMSMSCSWAILRTTGEERGLRRRRGLPGGGDSARLGLDLRHDGVDRDGLSFLDLDLGERAGRRRGDLGVHLVRRDLEDRLVARHLVSRLLEPAREGPLRD